MRRSERPGAGFLRRPPPRRRTKGPVSRRALSLGPQHVSQGAPTRRPRLTPGLPRLGPPPPSEPGATARPRDTRPGRVGSPLCTGGGLESAGGSPATTSCWSTSRQTRGSGSNTACAPPVRHRPLLCPGRTALRAQARGSEPRATGMGGVGGGLTLPSGPWP